VGALLSEPIELIGVRDGTATEFRAINVTLL
jgi:hypothetical protein